MTPDPSVSWPQALAWRLRRQLLAPGIADPSAAADPSVAAVVRLLCAVPAEHSPELAVGIRRRDPGPGDLARALAAGEVIMTFAFRGATHLLDPVEGGAYLALRAVSRMWELPSWQSYYGLAPEDWPRLRATVREILSDGPLTHDELGAALTARPEYRHLRSAFDAGAWTLLKPLAWQGDLSLGPGGTFQRLDDNPHWTGLPDLDDAGRYAVESYVRAVRPDHARPPAVLARQRAERGQPTDPVLDRLAGVPVRARRRRRQGLVRPSRRRRRASGDPPDDRRPAPAQVRPVGARPRHDGDPRGAARGAHARQSRRERRARGRRGVRDLVAAGDDVTVVWFTEPRDVSSEVERLATITGRPLGLVA